MHDGQDLQHPLDCEIQPNRGLHFFCFLLFSESFNCCNFGTTCPIEEGFSAKCTSPNEEFNQLKTEMSYVQLPTEYPRSHHMKACLSCIGYTAGIQIATFAGVSNSH